MGKISRRKINMFLSVGISLFALGSITNCSAPKNAASTDQPETLAHIYLVRHAEKITGPQAGRNPELSGAGKKRAQILVAVLADKNIGHIHSTNFIRTIDTATPLANALGLEIKFYDPRDLGALATKIREQGGHHLVVGHSNTTPQAVIALGSETVYSPIDEKNEYDRLYEVQILSDSVKTKLTRYGELYQATD